MDFDKFTKYERLCLKQTLIDIVKIVLILLKKVLSKSFEEQGLDTILETLIDIHAGKMTSSKSLRLTQLLGRINRKLNVKF